MDRQEEFVLRTLEERDIRFVRLWFTDVLGYLKSVAVAPAELEGAFAEGIGFDGSAIEGFARVYEADMIAKPDPSTFQLLPWRGEASLVGRMFCDIRMPDGSPSYADPRSTYATNVMGTVNVLESVRQVPGVRVVVNVTSDKCYENHGWEWGYRESEPMGGADPYSSSKG